MLAEGFGTFLLVLIVFFLTESCNLGRPNDNIAPLFIGLTVTSIICLIAPLTQAGLNPARDFSPRMVAWIFGWGDASFPDATGGFVWVYVAAPFVGGMLAGGLFTHWIEPLMNHQSEKCDCQ
jgi:glycerol uptake facilitator protein